MKGVDADRRVLERQTERNVLGLEHERRGETEEAIRLYEENVAEGFQGDWPYARLVGIYSRQGRLADVVRVLEAAVAALGRPGPKPASERRALLRVFRRRLQEARKALTGGSTAS